MSMSAGLRMIRGSAKVFVAELLVVPSGVILITFLTRKLHPGEFGLYVLATAVIAWIEWSLNTFFSRSSVRLIGETEDWQPVAASVLRLNVLLSSFVAGALALLAPVFARWFGEPQLVALLRLLALDVPFWLFVQAHRSFAIGRESYSVRWRLAAVRWILRPVLIVTLVSIFGSAQAAVAGWILTSCVEALLCLIWLPLRRSATSFRAVWSRLVLFAAPLSAFGMILRFYDKLDLFLLKMLGTSTAATGIYGAAQSISLAPGIMTLSLAPLLLGTVTRTAARGNNAEARAISRATLHFLIALLPAVLIAGAFPEQIAGLVLGKNFHGAAEVLRMLMISAYFTSALSFCSAIQTAFGRPAMSLWFALPMLPVAIGADLVLIPLYGPPGAATVSACVAGAAAVPLMVATYRMVRISQEEHVAERISPQFEQSA